MITSLFRKKESTGVECQYSSCKEKIIREYPELKEIVEEKNTDQLMEFLCSRDSTIRLNPSLFKLCLQFFKEEVIITMNDLESISVYHYRLKEISDDQFSMTIFNHWKDLSLSAIERAEYLNTIKNIFPFLCLKNDEVNTRVFVKWMQFCETIDDLLCINQNAKRYFSRSIIEESIDSFLFRAIPMAKDISEIKKCFKLASSTSSAKILAYEKWLELCTTPEEANEVFNNTANSELMCKLKAYDKIKELSYALISKEN